MYEFQEFPKISRARREVICTEKIDGTNAQIFVVKASEAIQTGGEASLIPFRIGMVNSKDTLYDLFAGSRNRWITPAGDNYGFARWALEHAQELVDGLGEGHHYGEWWGNGIQRRYDLPEKRFSLFNVTRWTAEHPACCHVVPILHQGTAEEGFSAVDVALDRLRKEGSLAAPGYMNPEGVVAFHTASGYLFKATLEKDDQPKGNYFKGMHSKNATSSAA
jgi:RNA ligase